MLNINNKNNIRKNIKQKFANYKKSSLLSYSYKINNNLWCYLTSLKVKPTSVALYFAIKHEPNLFTTAKKLNNIGISVLFPVINNNYLQFNKYNFNLPFTKQIQYNNYNIPQLINSNFIKPSIIVAPMLAFNLYGNRVGYGKAFYDTTLNNYSKKPLYVGVAYAWQQVNSINTTSNDANLNCIITNKFTHTVST